MKNFNINNVIISVGFILIYSCNVLDQEPETQISDQRAFTDEKSAEAALAGLYHQLQSGAYYGRNFQLISDVSSDVAQSVGTWDFYREMDTYSLDASNLELTNFYTAGYRTVNQANNILAEVPAIEMTQAKRDNILGQAYLIRGLAFFDLNRVFGGVPDIVGEQSVVLPLTPSRALNNELYPSRPSLVEGYNQVMSDLQDALRLLPEEQGTNYLNRSRATKSTARALLSRLHLYLKNYSEVITFSSEVIADNKYNLVNNYPNIFSSEFSSESIFELDFIVADPSGLRTWYFPGALGGRGDIAAHREFVELVRTDANDIRGTMFGFESVQGVYYPTKYQKPGNIDNAHIVRLAEMYLNRAEAYAHTGNLNLAVADLNAIKNRAGAETVAGNIDPQSFLLELEKERKIEFAFEGHSFFDLVRTGRALEVLGAVNRNNSTAPASLDQNWKQIMPIPRDEILSNPNMQQNPNYGN